MDWGNEARFFAARAHYADAFLMQEKRAYASLANGVIEDVELTAKPHRRMAVQDVNKWAIADTAKRRVEETRPDIPV